MTNVRPVQEKEDEDEEETGLDEDDEEVKKGEEGRMKQGE